jgi:hypothetical protein
MTKLSKMLFLFLAVLYLPSIASATYSLPSDRAVNWNIPYIGVQGDIPNRSTIYTTLSPSGGDDTSAIQNALNSSPAGQVVALNAGTFKISKTVNIPSNVTLRGAGRSATTIAGQSGFSGGSLITMSKGSGYGSSYSASGSLSKGQTTVTLSSSPGWAVGTLVLIDQANSSVSTTTVSNSGSDGTCSWCGRSSGTRSSGQVNRVAAISGSTVTFETPLMTTFASGTQFTTINTVTTGAGLESLCVNNQLSANSSMGGGNGATVAIYNASNCWVLNVDMNGSYLTMLRILNSYGCTIRQCLLHEGTPSAFTAGAAAYNTSRAYGIWLGPGSNNLIENNQLYHLAMPVKYDQPTSYNVMAYNVITNVWYSPNTKWNQASIEFHGAHPMMNLFEGNIVYGRLLADNIWGSSSHNTFFRNRANIAPGMTGALWDACLQAHAYYYNFVGNVMGTAGVEKTYMINNTTVPSSGGIFETGYSSDGDGSSSGNDANVFSTLLVQGNWDSVNNSTTWLSGSDTALPASLYRSSAPSWWGSAPFPAIGPDVTPMAPSNSYTMALGGANTPFDLGTKSSAYTITATAGTGGSISPSGAASVTAGATQAYTITAAAGYKIAAVTVDGASVGAVASYSFPNVSGNHTISATFASASYSITASAATGGSISPAGSTSIAAGGAQTYTITPASGYSISAVSVDGASVGAVTSYSFSNVQANHTIQASFATSATSGGSTGSTAYAVDCGGASYTDASGTVYKADANFSGGSVGTTTAAIAGTTDDVLYQSERYGNFTYSIPVANGSYNVTLKFAEGYFTAAGKRVFNVAIGGTTVISNLDIYAKAGQNSAYDVVVPATVTNGTLSIQFTSVVNNAEVRGIRIVPATTATAPTTGATVFAANAGGASYSTASGVTYQADGDFSGGSTGSGTATISGTSDPKLYQSERYGNFNYSIPVANGNYNVTLKFAETYFTAAGQRVFSVAVGGSTVISNLDLFAKAGKNAAYDVTVPVSVTNGVINLNFISQVNNAQVNAILVQKM